MTFRLTYCVPCRCERRARAAAQAVRDQTELLSRTEGSFPSTDDVVAAVRAARGNGSVRARS
jgi:hypothetical protein